MTTLGNSLSSLVYANNNSNSLVQKPRVQAATWVQQDSVDSLGYTAYAFETPDSQSKPNTYLGMGLVA
jgi:hypothetical protein